MEHFQYQLFFDGKKQCRYFHTRCELLRFVLSMSLRAQDNRFEVWEDAGEVRLADGRTLGRRFAKREELVMSDLSMYGRVAAELAALEASAAGAEAR